MPEGLRALGFVVHAMADVCPLGQDQGVTDEQWIADADAADSVALTKDERITRYEAEQEAFVSKYSTITSPVRFWLPIANTRNVLLVSAACSAA